MTVLLIAGSPSERSRSAALLDAAGQRLAGRGAHLDQVHIRDLSPQALLLADVTHRSVSQAIDQVARAQVERRSEEGREGNECRSWWSPYDQ